MSPPNPHLSGKPPPEKSKFMQTCNRLSLFLREKRNFEFNASGVSPATADLLSIIDDPVAKSIPPQYVILDSSSEPEDPPKTAQMTIFYQGQVLVVDDVPSDTATDLMLMAKNGKRSSSGSKEALTKDSDLPIARRASLHKFLAKRKDRATVRAPYQLHNQSPGPSGNEYSFDLNL